MKELSRQAAAAKAIREKLKAAFPGIHFRVTSHSFANGDAVDVYWTDGPTSEQVSAITAVHQIGSVNCMEDLYEYTNVHDDIPQSKYVLGHREISAETKAIIAAELSASWGTDILCLTDAECIKRTGSYAQSLIYGVVYSRSFAQPATASAKEHT